MRISPLQYNINYLKNEKKPLLTKPQNISFGAIQSRYGLMSKGYQVVKINNDKLNSKADKIIIDSPEKFVALSNSPSMWNRKIVLSSDIDLSKVENYKPIGTKDYPFTGEFDGNDCIINGLNINTGDNNVGLFGFCRNAVLKNVNIKEASVDGKSQSGILAGSANRCVIDNCTILNSNIYGTNKVGGLLGLSIYNTIQNIMVRANVNSSKNSCGGVIGYDESSELSFCYSDSDVFAREEVGGLIGYSNYSTINNSYSTGSEFADEKGGGLVGWGDCSNLSKCYAKNTYQLVGYNNNSTITDCVESRLDMNRKRYIFDSVFWDNGIYSDFSYLPRLNFVVEKERPEKIFLDDVKHNIERMKFEIKEKSEYSAFAAPEHYPENDKYLETAKNSTDTEELQDLFGSFALDLYYNMENKKYDEIFLALVQNPNFKPNKIYKGMENDNFSCTPLFILTTLNRPYILREALKRDDLGDIEEKNGWWATGKKSMMERAIDHNLLDCVYVMLMAKNQKFDIDKHRKHLYNASKEMKNLFKMYPNLPDYENFCEEKRNIKNINSLAEVLTSVDIPPEFEDSQGNTILNLAPMQEDEQLGLQLALTAIYRGLDVNHSNKKGERPMPIALENNRYAIIYNLLKANVPLKEKNNSGEDAIFVFSKIDNEKMANNFIDFCFKGGMSINTQDDKGCSLLENVIKLKKYEVLENLLTLGVGVNLPDYAGETPLHYACSIQDEKAMTLLLENFADVFALNANGKSPKDYLTDEKLIKIYENYEKMYKENNILPSESPYFVKKDELQIMSEKNKATRLFPELLINTTDSFGNSFLHISSEDKTHWGKEFIKVAFDMQKDINSTNYEGKTPLMLAIDAYNYCDNNTERMNVLGNIKYLLEKNPDIEIVDNNGQSALHSACKTDNSVIVNMLLRKDPKINVKDKNGNAPMNYIESDVVKKVMDEYVQKITRGM